MFKGIFDKDPIGSFWDWVSENRERINSISGPNDPVIKELTRKLEKVHKGLVWEAGQNELTISADGLLELFPVVERVVHRAPRMSGWKVNAFRQPVRDPAIQLGGIQFAARDLRVELVPIDTKFGIYVYFQNFTPGGPHLQIATHLLDATLGEQVSAKNIIDMVCKPHTPDCESLPTMIELRNRFGVPEPAG